MIFYHNFNSSEISFDHLQRNSFRDSRHEDRMGGTIYVNHRETWLDPIEEKEKEGDDSPGRAFQEVSEDANTADEPPMDIEEDNDHSDIKRLVNQPLPGRDRSRTMKSLVSIAASEDDDFMEEHESD